MNKESLTIGYDIKNNEGITLTKDERFKNIAIIGPVESCRSSFSMKTFIDQDIKNNRSVILIESKGELSEDVYSMCKHYNRKLTYFSLLNQKESVKYNPLVGNEYSVSKRLLNAFISAINTPLTKAQKQYIFNLLKNSLYILNRTYRQANLRDLYYLITNQDECGIEILVAFNKLCDIESFEYNIDVCSEILNHYKSENNKNFETEMYSILEEILNNEFLNKVLVLDRLDKNELNFDKLLEENSVIAISTSNSNLGKIGKILDDLLIDNISQSILNTNNKKRDYFKSIYMEEAEKYLNPKYLNILKQGDKYNISSIISLQNSKILLDNNKTKHMYNEIINNIENIIIYPGCNRDEAKKYAKVYNTYCNHEKLNEEDIMFRKFGEAISINPINTQLTKPIKVELIPKSTHEAIEKIKSNIFYN